MYEKTITLKIILLSIIFTLNIITGNMSLRYCSISFVQITRAIIPFITMGFSILFLGSKYSISTFISCIVISIGVGLSCFGEINLTVKGLLITLLGCFLSSLKSILIKEVLTGEYVVESSDLLTRISPFSAIEMYLLLLYNKENTEIVISNKYKGSKITIIGAIVSGIIAYFLNLANFKATHYTAPLTVTIVGCIKQIFTIVISVLIFDKTITPLNIAGIAITTIGSLWYSILGIKKKVNSTLIFKKLEV